MSRQPDFKRDLIKTHLDYSKAKLDLALVEFLMEAQRVYPVGCLLTVNTNGRTVRAKVLRHGTGYVDFNTLYVLNTNTGKERKLYIGSDHIELVRHAAAESEAA